ncbi:MAG: PQQ-binding-like beta-propeller repeat protein [Euryarchaeota archaeon]|nr:PQQ-binding-like beta-propeller repeat protein [Euryarchaeota archaeon]MDE2046305.1 PQQ-binding-like beta-propeller repeat protein [Thermoplasmata archaeon]
MTSDSSKGRRVPHRCSGSSRVLRTMLLLGVATLATSCFPWEPGSPSGSTPANERATNLAWLRSIDLSAPGSSSGGNATVSLSSWPGFAGGGNLSGMTFSGAPSTNGTLWETYTGTQAVAPTGAPGVAAPAVVDGVVYEGTGSSGGVIALNATTGAYLWSTTLPLKVPVFGGLLVADHRVFVPAWQSPSNGSGILYALNATNGGVLWSASVGVRGPFIVAPNLVDGVVMEADSGAGYAYGWTEDGSLAYARPLGGPVDQPVSVLSPTVPLALAVAGSELVAYNATTGLSFPGISWSPLPLSAPSNGSAVQTPFVWEPHGGKTVNVPLAIVADDAGSSGPSEVSVLAPLGVPAPASAPPLVLASWSTPVGGGGFTGTPTLLGERGGNLTFTVDERNGTLAIFRFGMNSTGAGNVAPIGFVPWSTGGVTPPALGSPVSSAGEVLLGTPAGLLDAVDTATRTVLWHSNLSSPIESSPAVLRGVAFVASEGGVLRAVGGSSTPPSAPRLLLTISAPPWVEGSQRANVTVAAKLWYPNGSQPSASGARVAFAGQPGSVVGNSTELTSSRGLANFTYAAPAVSQEVNATLYVNASWGKLTNNSWLRIVLVPPRLVNDTPLAILAQPAPPVSLSSGQSLSITFSVRVGSGGPPLSGALASFTAFGGTTSTTTAYTSTSGNVTTTFVAGSASSSTSTAGLTLTVEEPGYEIGTYAWVTEVNPLPQLVLEFAPASLLLLAGTTKVLAITVSSSLDQPVQGAILALGDPPIGGNLTSPGGLTDAHGQLIVAYEAPSRVPSPGSTSFIAVSATASGFVTVRAQVPVTVVPNGTGSPSGPNPNANGSNPLAGLSPWEGWGLLAALVVLAFAVLVLRVREARTQAQSRRSVWEEWEKERSEPDESVLSRGSGGETKRTSAVASSPTEDDKSKVPEDELSEK